MADSTTNVPPPPHTIFDTILVLDFGSQYTHLITRRLRELSIYSEMLPCTQKISELSFKPKGIILSGGPYSVYWDDAPHVDPAVFEMGVPILGICYGLQEIAWHSDQKNVVAGEKREYGHAILNVQKHSGKTAHVDALFAGLEEDMDVWMSHGDKLSQRPAGFVTVAASENAPYAGIAHEEKEWFGIQFHPEVTHTKKGTPLIKNFAVSICGAKQDWTMDAFVGKEIDRIRALVGPKGQVIGAVSGGVDSTVAAKLMHEAIGDRFHAIMVDNGVLRLNEAKQVKETLTAGLGINLTVIDASDRFLDLLAGVKDDPEKKRKIIGNTFIEIFQEKAKEIAAAAKGSANEGEIEWLLQGTLYPDVIESISFKGPSATIKTHHNVGGLLEGMHLKLIEPLRELFKDEVRALGTQLGIPEDLVWRHPFPGPGLAIRIIGEVTRDQVRIAQQADFIFIDEIKKAGYYKQISQAYAALLPVKAVGVMGDKRVHAQVIALRAVETTDFMTADVFDFPTKFLSKVSTRIVNEVDGVCRVLYEGKSPQQPTSEVSGHNLLTAQ
ncbi:GMP synthase subunit B [Aureobasidium pullulans]|jgi:GMP synthase (glutamine-hydrolysing)|uniref:GMP synthase [glutamine-hydrolyzing] n=1 Tax=Aureobasidium pullulans TaxID=5580 RepID=A0A4S9B5D3_AURPU|nr:GMP synthase subunit B [Aureobasidium pullulans]THW14192.1 GMP synthase subunit B [Aureobasidium pullulans]THW87929.1 GMP synthase subunit B [Aureobasidium pullulans]THX35866.1 GMP synthase subunit B [Aureobasidium pullulans]THX68072.1 GMP synthase subunit B [Aureobasidium pullulans]